LFPKGPPHCVRQNLFYLLSLSPAPLPPFPFFWGLVPPLNRTLIFFFCGVPFFAHPVFFFFPFFPRTHHVIRAPKCPCRKCLPLFFSDFFKCQLTQGSLETERRILHAVSPFFFFYPSDAPLPPASPCWHLLPFSFVARFCQAGPNGRTLVLPLGSVYSHPSYIPIRVKCPSGISKTPFFSFPGPSCGFLVTRGRSSPQTFWVCFFPSLHDGPLFSFPRRFAKGDWVAFLSLLFYMILPLSFYLFFTRYLIRRTKGLVFSAIFGHPRCSPGSFGDFHPPLTPCCLFLFCARAYIFP